MQIKNVLQHESLTFTQAGYHGGFENFLPCPGFLSFCTYLILLPSGVEIPGLFEVCEGENAKQSDDGKI